MSDNLQSHCHYLVQRYLLMTLDPLHIGTGGYRLGRVDLSIVREPGTRLPKIPGTSLAGAARSYAAMRYGKIRCAGQGGADQPHCGQPTCPICYTFGYITKNKQGDEQNAHSGVVNVTDAHILLFPVHSVAGPVWISTPQRLREAGFKNVQPESVPDEQIYLSWNHPNRLNLGWLMLDVAPPATFTPPEVWKNDPHWTAVQKRIVLVSDSLFSHIVNSNLEVRTSVSIDPRTGAAADKALFTYEALPRATWLWLDVVEDDYRRDFPTKEKLEKWEQDLKQNGDEAAKLLKRWLLWKESDASKQKEEARKKASQWVDDDLGRYRKAESLPSTKQGWQKQHQNQQNTKQEDSREGPIDVVRAGLELAEYLGIGGMGTRGFGRIRIVGNPIEINPLEQTAAQNDQKQEAAQ